jgi:hypothetical protein
MEPPLDPPFCLRMCVDAITMANRFVYARVSSRKAFSCSLTISMQYSHLSVIASDGAFPSEAISQHFFISREIASGYPHRHSLAPSARAGVRPVQVSTALRSAQDGALAMTELQLLKRKV